MSYVSLAADAERMCIPLWHMPRERRYRKTSECLRNELTARLLGPNHPGFRGKQADIDAHITRLVDCRQGRYGHALRIAITAYETAQRNAAGLALLTSKRRPNTAEVTYVEADVRQWSDVSRAAYTLYRAARAVRGEDALSILPTDELADYTKPWPIPKPAAVAGDTDEALVSASHEAIRIARLMADTARRRAEIQIQGFEYASQSVPQMLVADLEGFARRLDAEYAGRRVVCAETD